MNIEPEERKIIEKEETFLGHKNIVVSCAYFGHPHHVIASSEYESRIMLWKRGNKSPVKKLKDLYGVVNHVIRWNKDTLITCDIKNNLISYSMEKLLKMDKDDINPKECRIANFRIDSNSHSMIQILKLSDTELVVAYWKKRSSLEGKFLIFSYIENSFEKNRELEKEHHGIMDETKLIKSTNFNNCFYYNNGNDEIRLVDSRTESQVKIFYKSEERVVVAIEMYVNKKKEEILIFGGKKKVFFRNIGKSKNDIKEIEPSNLYELDVGIDRFSSSRCFLNRVLILGGNCGSVCLLDLDDFSIIARNKYHTDCVYDVQFILDPNIEEFISNDNRVAKKPIRLNKIQFITASGDKKIILQSVDGLDIQIDAIDSQATEDMEERISFLKADVDLYSTKNEVKFFNVNLQNEIIGGTLKILFV